MIQSPTIAVPSTRTGFAAARPTSTQTGSTALDVWAFVLPALSFLEITLVGRLLVSELVALALLPWLLGQKERLGFHDGSCFWAGWLISQVLYRPHRQ